ncbi:taste receptor type 2 member 40-like [Pleurodeles waltl]|uniref:taste receptor type 2 member 40-like n=1 Tax=Pleurodeles waltl TaxID=8319 RepID=UPI003709B9F1
MEFTTGVVANGFLIIVSVMDYFRTPSFGPSSIILGSLGLTRFGFQCALIISNILPFLLSDSTRQGKGSQTFIVLWMFLNFSSLWCATWLCVYYCVKIANFTNRAFSFLKLRFSKLLPFLLLGSLLVSLAFSLPLCMDIKIFGNMNKTFSQNNTVPAFIANINYSSWSLLCTLGSLMPFSLFWLAAALLNISLRRHTLRIKGSDMGGFRNPSIMAHCRAVGIMIVFFLFYASFVAAVNVSASGILCKESLQSFLCEVVISAYPSLHSLALILSNSKLREAAFRALPCATSISRPGELQVSSIFP